MSTRSIIARKTEDGFEGTCHHWDGYPIGLGYSLWYMYQVGGRDLEGMLKLLIDEHPAGWSTINGVDWDQPIGYIAGYEKGREMNAPQCFCHGDRSETVDEPYTNLTDCGAEFAYAFEKDAERETDLMYIFEKQYDDGSHAMEFFGMTSPDGGWKLIRVIDLLGEYNRYNDIEEWKSIVVGY